MGVNFIINKCVSPLCVSGHSCSRLANSCSSFSYLGRVGGRQSTRRHRFFCRSRKLKAALTQKMRAVRIVSCTGTVGCDTHGGQRKTIVNNPCETDELHLPQAAVGTMHVPSDFPTQARTMCRLRRSPFQALKSAVYFVGPLTTARISQTRHALNGPTVTLYVISLLVPFSRINV